MTAPLLKPCPFCGCASIYAGCRSGTIRAGQTRHSRNERKFCAYLECECCLATMFDVFYIIGPKTRYPATRDAAIDRIAARWNARAVNGPLGEMKVWLESQLRNR